MGNDLKRTALYQCRVDHGERNHTFAGWEMPVQYPAGPLQEHHATRQAANFIDIDHMGQVEVRGPQAEAFMNRIITYDVSQMNLFDAHYALFCYADGGTVDDLLVYRLPDPHIREREYVFRVINAANRPFYIPAYRR